MIWPAVILPVFFHIRILLIVWWRSWSEEKLNNNETTRRKEFYLAVFARGQAKVYAGTATRALLKKKGLKK